MKLDTTDLVACCYEELQRKHPTRPVTAKRLSEYVPGEYCAARNGLIDRTAKRLERLFGKRLLEWTEEIWNQVYEVDGEYYWECTTGDIDPDDDEDMTYGNAHALAVLLFFRSIERGHIAYGIEFSEEEAAAWLAQYAVPIHRNPAQRSLFSVMGAA